MKAKHLYSGLTMLLLAGLVSKPAAWAYPPAPDDLIYCVAKDEYGNPLANPNDLVVLQTVTGVQIVANIQPSLAVGINYALQVPRDTGSIPRPYVSNALTNGVQFQLLVVVGGTTNIPIEMQGAYLTTGPASERLLQNLTLGQELGQSGVPLAWAQAFLASLGLNIPAGSINPYAVYTQDGRTLQQEYLLGNFPYQTNAFAVRIVSQSAGSAVLAFTTIAGRTYTASGSSNLKTWTPLSFTIPALGPGSMTSYHSTTNQPLQIRTMPPGTASPSEFFRLQLQ